MEMFAGITKSCRVNHSSGRRLFQKQHFHLMGQQCVQSVVLSLCCVVVALCLQESKKTSHRPNLLKSFFRKLILFPLSDEQKRYETKPTT
jgi:hypothetical protein